VLVLLGVLTLGKYSLWLLVSRGPVLCVSDHDIKNTGAASLPKAVNALVAPIFIAIALSVRRMRGIRPCILHWINVVELITLLIQFASCGGNLVH
jgi:hypothetical protein